MNLSWNVMLYSNKRLSTYDVFSNHSFNKAVNDLFNESELDFQYFSASIKSLAMWQFWSRTEYEFIISNWPPFDGDPKIKIDVLIGNISYNIFGTVTILRRILQKMLSKNLFCILLNDIVKKHDNFLNKTEDLIGVPICEGPLVHHQEIILDALTEEFELSGNECLESIIFDWCYNYNFGESNDPLLEIDGVPRVIKSAEELYGLLVELYNDRKRDD